MSDKIFDCIAGHEASGPTHLQTVAAGWTVDVEDVADQVEVREES